MKERAKVYYTIEKHNNIWTVWRNAERNNSCGCYGLFSGALKECKQYASDNKIRIKGGKKNILVQLPTYTQLSKRRIYG